MVRGDRIDSYAFRSEFTGGIPGPLNQRRFGGTVVWRIHLFRAPIQALIWAHDAVHRRQIDYRGVVEAVHGKAESGQRRYQQVMRRNNRNLVAVSIALILDGFNASRAA